MALLTAGSPTHLKLKLKHSPEEGICEDLYIPDKIAADFTITHIVLDFITDRVAPLEPGRIGYPISGWVNCHPYFLFQSD